MATSHRRGGFWLKFALVVAAVVAGYDWLKKKNPKLGAKL